MTTPKKPGATQRRGRSKGAAAVTPDVMAKQQRCADLAVQGLTYAEIAEHEGYSSESGARAAVQAVFKRAATEAAEIVRPKMIARAEALWMHGFGVLREGRDIGDMDMFVRGANVADKALARLMKLYGLDSPDVSVHIGADAGELERLKADALVWMNNPAGGVVDAEVVDSAPE